MLEEKAKSSKHLETLSHFIVSSCEHDILGDQTYSELNSSSLKNKNVSDSIIKEYFKGGTIELAIQDCPKLLQKDFQDIFVEMPPATVTSSSHSHSNLTVISITQLSENNMAEWNDQVYEEREKLMEKFVQTATEICHLLRANNFWSDFIDPSSGQAFFGTTNSSSALFETDDKYLSQLGDGKLFEIEDLGCCRVISHDKWGSNVFSGCVVTNCDKNNMQIFNKILEPLLNKQ